MIDSSQFYFKDCLTLILITNFYNTYKKISLFANYGIKYSVNAMFSKSRYNHEMIFHKKDSHLTISLRKILMNKHSQCSNVNCVIFLILNDRFS